LVTISNFLQLLTNNILRKLKTKEVTTHPVARDQDSELSNQPQVRAEKEHKELNQGLTEPKSRSNATLLNKTPELKFQTLQANHQQVQ
jgi:hypothetical protein